MSDNEAATAIRQKIRRTLLRLRSDWSLPNLYRSSLAKVLTRMVVQPGAPSLAGRLRHHGGTSTPQR
jgi:hypothetical protein